MDSHVQRDNWWFWGGINLNTFLAAWKFNVSCMSSIRYSLKVNGNTNLTWLLKVKIRWHPLDVLMEWSGKRFRTPYNRKPTLWQGQIMSWYQPLWLSSNVNAKVKIIHNTIHVWALTMFYDTLTIRALIRRVRMETSSYLTVVNTYVLHRRRNIILSHEIGHLIGQTYWLYILTRWTVNQLF